jgi:hypothetical protein
MAAWKKRDARWVRVTSAVSRTRTRIEGVVQLLEEVVGRWYPLGNARRHMRVEWLQLVRDRGRLEGYGWPPNSWRE